MFVVVCMILVWEIKLLTKGGGENLESKSLL